MSPCMQMLYGLYLILHYSHSLYISPSAQLTERALSSVSSDSGLSTNSLWTRAAGAGLQRQATLRDTMAGEQPRVHVLTSEIAITSDGDERARGEIFHHTDPVFHMNGKSTSAQRETNILDDEDERTYAAIASNPKETSLKLPVLSRCAYTAWSEDAGDGAHPDDTWTPTRTSSSNDQTHIWVKQQQLVSADCFIDHMSDRLEHKVEPGMKTDSTEAEPEADKDDEFASLALDIDQSIEQLNQLILDLDPEFEPVPTLARGHTTCSTSVRTNGVGHLVGQATSNQSGNISPVTWRHYQLINVYAENCFKDT